MEKKYHVTSPNLTGPIRVAKEFLELAMQEWALSQTRGLGT